MHARWDAIAAAYADAVADSVDDPATASLLGLVGDVGQRTVVDLACGNGRVTRELARRGAVVVGVDVSSRLLQHARDSEAAHPLGVRYVHGDAATSLPADGSVDVVVCNFGLSDIDDLAGTVRATGAALRDGGVFVFSLLHPCFPGWDDDAPSSWPPDRGYHAEGWWLAANTGFRGSVGANHRMLSTYINALRAAGLVIDALEEPRPDDDWDARNPGAAPVPTFLTGRCRRTQSPGG